MQAKKRALETGGAADLAAGRLLWGQNVCEGREVWQGKGAVDLRASRLGGWGERQAVSGTQCHVSGTQCREACWVANSPTVHSGLH